MFDVQRTMRASITGLALLVAGSASAANLSCSSSTTLESLVDCISRQMPQHESNGYVAPTGAQLSEFRTVVASMLSGQCDFTLPQGIRNNMAIRSFTDSGNGRSYCVLMEVLSTVKPGYVDKGWGTFIVDNNATREIAHVASHPKFDLNTTGAPGDAFTEREAVRIFKQTASRSYLMAGARRSANTASSACQSSYKVSDAAHNTATMFFTAYQALQDFYGSDDWTAIEWHAKAASSCENDMFMSAGVNTLPAAGSKVMLLKQQIQLQRPSWVVETTGASSCTLSGTTNTAGRLLNGVAASSVCGTGAKAASGRFMHIEQTATVISADLNGTSTAWANAIKAAFP